VWHALPRPGNARPLGMETWPEILFDSACASCYTSELSSMSHRMYIEWTDTHAPRAQAAKLRRRGASFGTCSHPRRALGS
jgi:organic hydroperoxide reductase OsmC/OhrA